MSSPQSLSALQTLLERNEQHRDTALVLAQQARVKAEAARAQADQLSSYRGEYHQRWTKAFTQRATVEILGCYQSFGTRLNEAISSQGHVSDHADAQLARAEAHLRDCEMRVAAVRKLIERRELEQRRKALASEQRSADEQAARTAQHSPHAHWRAPI